MVYKISVERRARKKMRHFPKDILRDIDSAILALRNNPRPRGCRKIKGRENAWRIVIRKDYRVLYTVDDTTRRIEVYDVDRKEKDIYR